jgi:hypothetical protein
VRSLGNGLDRRFADSLSAVSRSIRLRDYSDYRVPRLKQGLESWYGEMGRAEEHDAQRTGRYHLPERWSFLIRRTIRSRLIPRKRSTNNWPSR